MVYIQVSCSSFHELKLLTLVKNELFDDFKNVYFVGHVETLNLILLENA